jgi:hypothetical protein
MAMESLSKRNGTSMLDCETYKSIRYNPFVPPVDPVCQTCYSVVCSRGV